MSYKKYGGARGRHKSGVMNSLERWYASRLDILKNSGDVIDYWFESVKFKLADKTFYTPDFLVMMANCELEIHECKGFMLDDANVKIKVAADKFPFKFKLIKNNKGILQVTEIGNKEV